jgi:hypothetical protein
VHGRHSVRSSPYISAQTRLSSRNNGVLSMEMISYTCSHPPTHFSFYFRPDRQATTPQRPFSWCTSRRNDLESGPTSQRRQVFAHFRFDVNHVGRTYSFAARWKNAVYAICIMRHSKMHTGINSWKCVVGTWKRTQPTQQSVSRNANRCFGFFCTRWWHPWECRIFRDLLMAVRDEIPQPLYIIRLTHERKKCAGVNVYFRRKLPPLGYSSSLVEEVVVQKRQLEVVDVVVSFRGNKQDSAWITTSIKDTSDRCRY